jgi:hypothetical protein
MMPSRLFVNPSSFRKSSTTKNSTFFAPGGAGDGGGGGDGGCGEGGVGDGPGRIWPLMQFFFGGYVVLPSVWSFRMHWRSLCVYAEQVLFWTHFKQHSSAEMFSYFTRTHFGQGAQSGYAEGHVLPSWAASEGWVWGCCWTNTAQATTLTAAQKAIIDPVLVLEDILWMSFSSDGIFYRGTHLPHGHMLLDRRFGF